MPLSSLLGRDSSDRHHNKSSAERNAIRNETLEQLEIVKALQTGKALTTKQVAFMASRSYVPAPHTMSGEEMVLRGPKYASVSALKDDKQFLQEMKERLERRLSLLGYKPEDIVKRAGRPKKEPPPEPREQVLKDDVVEPEAQPAAEPQKTAQEEPPPPKEIANSGNIDPLKEKPRVIKTRVALKPVLVKPPEPPQIPKRSRLAEAFTDNDIDRFFVLWRDLLMNHAKKSITNGEHLVQANRKLRPSFDKMRDYFEEAAEALTEKLRAENPELVVIDLSVPHNKKKLDEELNKKVRGKIDKHEGRTWLTKTLKELAPHYALICGKEGRVFMVVNDHEGLQKLEQDLATAEKLPTPRRYTSPSLQAS